MSYSSQYSGEVGWDSTFLLVVKRMYVWCARRGSGEVEVLSWPLTLMMYVEVLWLSNASTFQGEYHCYANHPCIVICDPPPVLSVPFSSLPHRF